MCVGLHVYMGNGFSFIKVCVYDTWFDLQVTVLMSLMSLILKVDDKLSE